jgi:hypothetical protein
MAMLKKHGDRQTGLVFIGRRGKPLVVGNVNEYVLKPILKKVEFPYARRTPSGMEPYPGFKRPAR